MQWLHVGVAYLARPAGLRPLVQRRLSGFKSMFRDRWDGRFSLVRADWQNRPVDTRFAPLILISIPSILLAAFALVAFVGWNLGVFRQ
jgi:hypothetical protein